MLGNILLNSSIILLQLSQGGKHHCAGFNHQIICTLDGVPLVITDPVPGAHHDTFAYWWHGLDRFLDPHDTLADKGYQGLDLITPVKKLPGGELTDDGETPESAHQSPPGRHRTRDRTLQVLAGTL